MDLALFPRMFAHFFGQLAKPLLPMVFPVTIFCFGASHSTACGSLQAMPGELHFVVRTVLA